jgi:hypothetical protein
MSISRLWQSDAPESPSCEVRPRVQHGLQYWRSVPPLMTETSTAVSLASMSEALGRSFNRNSARDRKGRA